MKAIPHLLRCMSCEHEFDWDIPLFIDLNADEDQPLIDYFFGPDAYHYDCPACGHDIHFDCPVAVYDVNGYQIRYYLPGWAWDEMLAPEYFEPDGSPTFDLMEKINEMGRQNGCEVPAAFGYGIAAGKVRLRVFLTLEEMKAQIAFSARAFRVHQERMEFYKTLSPPPEFLARGSGRYRKSKLKLVYALGQAFRTGTHFSESDVNQIISRESRYFGEYDIEATQIRVALVELGILGRTSDCRTYWRQPSLGETNGFVFPQKVREFEKSGYLFYEGEGMGFSVGYRHTTKSTWGTCYIYDVGILFSDTDILRSQYDTALQELIDTHVESGEIVEIISEQSHQFKFDGGSAIKVLDGWSSSLRLRTSDGTMTSHVLVSMIPGNFVKFRFTAKEEVVDHEELFRGLTEDLLKKITSHSSP